jgi:Tfp pilus assembly protein PilF
LKEAEQAMRDALRADPQNPDLYLQSAKLATRAQNPKAALELLHRAQALKPDSAEILAAAGTVLFQLDRLSEARQAYEAAIKLSPGEFMSHHNLGVIHQRAGNFPSSSYHFSYAAHLMPSHALTRLNYGVVLRDMGKFAESTSQFQAATAIDPTLADGFMQLAWNALLAGDFARGWPLFEWRWRCGGVALPQFPQPIWDGSQLAGKSIMIHAEQGLGDTIQFSRYATLLAQTAREVTIYTPETLRQLMGTVPFLSAAVSRRDQLPAFDVWCPMMSLPLRCATTVETIPASIPYVNADPARVEAWKQLMASDTPGYRVGICWAGNPNNYNDVNRSLPLNMVKHFGQLPGVATYSLQVGYKTGSAQAFGMIDHTARLTDFSETAALMMNLDLIISVDTACAHLAGALGRKVWTLVPFAPEWRWMLDRPDSPWYPTMQIFRRSPSQSWGAVVVRVVNALHALVNQVAG